MRFWAAGTVTPAQEMTAPEGVRKSVKRLSGKDAR